jgi:hypothetical protein
MKVKNKKKKNKNACFKFNLNKIWHHEFEMKWTRLCCKIICQTNVELVESSGGSYLYLYPFKDLIQISLHEGFYMPIV